MSAKPSDADVKKARELYVSATIPEIAQALANARAEGIRAAATKVQACLLSHQKLTASEPRAYDAWIALTDAQYDILALLDTPPGARCGLTEYRPRLP